MSSATGSPFLHRFVPALDARAPVLLLLHGTGGDESSLLDFGRSMHPQAALLSPRGQVLEHGMPRFFRRLAEGIFDEADLIQRSAELAAFITDSVLEYKVTGRKVVALGYSNGANIAGSLLLLHPGILAGAVLLRAMVPLHPPQLPLLDGLPVFLATGEHDSMIPRENADRLAGLLRKAGAEVTHIVSSSGHQLVPTEIAAAQQWLRQHFS